MPYLITKLMHIATPLLITCLISTVASAGEQEPVAGIIVDQESQEPLTGAHVLIRNTFTGTNTNRDGAFELEPESFPVTLLVRYVGYETREVDIETPQQDLVIELEPGVVVMDELVVTDEDPALQIMQRVIERKQLWQEDLESWKAETYTRQNLNNDEGIVSITESYSTTWWHHDKGSREVITDQQQTNNLLDEDNFAASSYLPNFYDDEINLSGFDMIGVTHPDALDYYDFEIIEQREMEDHTIYDIKVIPKRRLQPLFEGEVSVHGGEYALLEVRLEPGDAVFFPPPVENMEIRYDQTFSNYGDDFWLPAGIRMSGSFDIGFPGLSIPQINLHQEASILDYEINPTVPDSLYEDEQGIRRDTAAIAQSLRFELDGHYIPLSEQETRAYQEIDTTQTLAEAFEPSGFLTRFLDTSEGGGEFSIGPSSAGSADGSNFSFGPDARYNRVDALYLGITPSLKLESGWYAEGLLGYNFGQDNLAFGGEIGHGFGTYQGAVRYESNTSERLTSDHYGRILTSAGPLFGLDDYFDHYQRDHLELRLSRRFNRFTPGLTYNLEDHSSLDRVTSYSFPGGFAQRGNPAIDDGRLSSVGLNLSAGNRPAPFGVTGNSGLKLSVEHSNKDLLGSDFSFTRAEANIDLRIDTFLQRRMMPNALDLRLRAFTSTGDLPYQRFMGIDGSMTGLTPFGAFKSSPNRQIEGEHGVALFWEHNFRTVPFELPGWQRWAENGLGLILTGGHGRTWIAEETLEELPGNPHFDDQWRHEIGVSVNNVFQTLRLDASYRIDEPGLYFGVSLSRFF